MTKLMALYDLPSDWQLTPLGKKDRTGKPNPKAPYLKNWAVNDIDRQAIERDLKSGKAIGIGLRLGEPSEYVVAIDFDGQSSIDFWVDKFGEIPKTVTWTSGKNGRFQALFTVPERYQNRAKSKVIKTGRAEQLEFRYTGCQSVLPPSPHPETDGYVWVNSPSETPVAELPQLVIDFWLELIEPQVPVNRSISPRSQPSYSPNDIPPIPLEICLAKSNRALLHGVGQGNRNQSGASLARDLIGTEKHLRDLGVSFTGSAIELFDLFVSRCSPPLARSESISIWKSAEKDNPEPSCKADGITNILTGWERKYSSTKPMNKTESNGHSTIPIRTRATTQRQTEKAQNRSLCHIVK
jgi:hypothetical protein